MRTWWTSPNVSPPAFLCNTRSCDWTPSCDGCHSYLCMGKTFWTESRIGLPMFSSDTSELPENNARQLGGKGPYGRTEASGGGGGNGMGRTRSAGRAGSSAAFRQESAPYWLVH